VDFSDGLTASAIILAVVAIVSQIAFFVVQTDRAAKSQREISDYVGQMRGVLGKIEGLTTGTREQLQEQFMLALRAAVGQDRALVADNLADKLGEIEDRMGALEESAAGQVGDDVRKQIDALKEGLSSLAAEVAGAAREPPTVAGVGPRGRTSLGYGVQSDIYPTGLGYGVQGDIYGTGPGGEESLFVSIEPLVVQPGGSVTMRQIVGPLTGITEGQCEVRTPGGRSLSVPWLSPSLSLVFPDDFPHASTQLPGEYSVTVRRHPLFSPTGTSRDVVFRGAFRVSSPEAVDD
jgi:hypothetical protein